MYLVAFSHNEDINLLKIIDPDPGGATIARG
jgi:hypothetical protein